MGTAELNTSTGELIINSELITYGNAANPELTERIRYEIEWMWNEPRAVVQVGGRSYRVRFSINSSFRPNLSPQEVYENSNPIMNYFRIENYAYDNISFVDGLGCNSGYFLAENLYEGSTTSAHEYGHTLGLPHPRNMDIRGEGVPGIMYPRGTLVDAPFQYDPSIPAGLKGGTMHPQYRRVRPQDIDLLRLHRLRWVKGFAVIGDFSSIYHTAHVRH